MVMLAFKFKQKIRRPKLNFETKWRILTKLQISFLSFNRAFHRVSHFDSARYKIIVYFTIWGNHQRTKE